MGRQRGSGHQSGRAEDGDRRGGCRGGRRRRAATPGFAQEAPPATPLGMEERLELSLAAPLSSILD